MPEKMRFEKREENFDPEKEINFEKIENLPDWEEPGAYYRGVKAEDALKAIFGELELNANPKEDIIGSRDNASLNLHEAIYFSPSCQTKKGEKFLCAIGFIPLPGAKIEDSFLKRATFVRVSGPVVAKEVVVRFASKKSEHSEKRIKYFSPKEFFQWYKETVI